MTPDPDRLAAITQRVTRFTELSRAYVSRALAGQPEDAAAAEDAEELIHDLAVDALWLLVQVRALSHAPPPSDPFTQQTIAGLVAQGEQLTAWLHEARHKLQQAEAELATRRAAPPTPPEAPSGALRSADGD